MGSIGTMTLAVMTWASRVHTGRSPTASAGTVVLYGLGLIAGLDRRRRLSAVDARAVAAIRPSLGSQRSAASRFFTAARSFCRDWIRSVADSPIVPNEAPSEIGITIVESNDCQYAFGSFAFAFRAAFGFRVQ
ncbi:NnrS family protein [Hyphomicrobium denitrificans]|uniref:NnrS family protein n=1 Tax=Hyphomicrobium denitrificans TaxID=53399 RepID=UPI001FCB1161|nr:NnrS family protein [Hyphomicrobium denitrificans]